MDEHEKVEEQVEDLDMPGEDAEEVKGGSLNFTQPAGASPQLGGNVRSQKVQPGGLDGTEHQHNETLVLI